MSKKVILLIDDDELFLMLTRRLLDGQPYLERIDTASTVQAVEAYFQQLKASGAAFPDAVFIDLDMPRISGLELAQQLRNSYIPKQAGGTKIFMLSSSISQRDRQTAEVMEAICGYMEKPLSAEMLRQALLDEKPQPKDRCSLHGQENQREDVRPERERR